MASEVTSSDFSLVHYSGQLPQRKCTFIAHFPSKWQEYSLFFVDSSNIANEGMESRRIKLMLNVHALFMHSNGEMQEKKQAAIYEQNGNIKTLFNYEGTIYNNKTGMVITIGEGQNKTDLIQKFFGHSWEKKHVGAIDVSISLAARKGEGKILETDPVQLPFLIRRKKGQSNQRLSINYPIDSEKFSIIKCIGKFNAGGTVKLSIALPRSWGELSISLIDRENFDQVENDESDAIYLMLRVTAEENAKISPKRASRNAIFKIGATFDSYFNYKGKIDRDNRGIDLNLSQKPGEPKTTIVSALLGYETNVSSKQIRDTTLSVSLQAISDGKVINETEKIELPVHKKKALTKRKSSQECQPHKRQKVTNRSGD